MLFNVIYNNKAAGRAHATLQITCFIVVVCLFRNFLVIWEIRNN